MKKSIDRCYAAAREKHMAMCGSPLEEKLNSIEAAKFSVLVEAGIVISTDVEYTVQEIDIDPRFIAKDGFLLRWW